jgi:hypothetical protein
MKTNPNDPIAYVDELQAIEGSEEFNRFLNYGLTKREYFAAMAMQGFTSIIHTAFDSQEIREIAEASIEMADTLIKTLNDESKNLV